MGKFTKLRERVLSGQSDSNVKFSQLRQWLRYLDFDERVKGSHYIFTHHQVSEIINIQPAERNKAKAYQVRQIREILVKYQLGATDDGQI